VTRARYRCPECRVIFPGPEYVCRGSWWIYDPGHAATPEDPTPRDPPHDPVLVVRDTQVGD
jgi:hypothetical protein